MQNKDFAPDDPELLMACFKKLDEDDTGIIEMDLMENYIT